MKIEPNKDVGMSAKTIMINNGSIHFPDGEVISSEQLTTSGNRFEELCNSIDPNLTFINVIIPDPIDNEIYFDVRDKGNELDIHVQSVTHRSNEAWQIWEGVKEK